MKTIDQMIAAIRSKVWIRKLWLCNAGWGMVFLDGDMGNALPADLEPLPIDGKPSKQTIVFQYYTTLETCVRAEYIVHALTPWGDEDKVRAELHQISNARNGRKISDAVVRKYEARARRARRP